VAVPGAQNGVYVEFDSLPGIEFELQRLDSVAANGPRLVAVAEDIVDDKPAQRAVVWIPEGGQSAFLRKFAQYAQTAEEPNPRNHPLVDRIDRIRLATLRSIWTDNPEDFPATDDAVWWELWLRRHDGAELERLEAFAAGAELILGSGRLSFTDRLVVLCLATAQRLARSLDSLDDLAEVRKPRPLTQLIDGLPSPAQRVVVNELEQRTRVAGPEAPAVSLLDSGVFQGHPLLAASLDRGDCFTCDANWRLDDEIGHGTRMAGLALYGDLAQALAMGQPVRLSHRLESVRIFPPRGQANPPELYGQLTALAASLVEIQQPNRRRVFTLAVSAPVSDTPPQTAMPWVGQPTSWSASIDALSAGLGVAGQENDLQFLREDEAQRRLFLIAVGNVDTYDIDYLARSDLELIDDPAQSWNAIGVGAYTKLTALNDPDFDGWNALATDGELSPHSRTSVAFNRVWPAKPDVVVEGGNVAVSPAEDEFAESLPELSLLTTRTMALDPRPLTTINMTSASTAQAAFIAGSILSDYPDLWPETVRALVIHSAEWTVPMIRRFGGAGSRNARNALRRRYGMGVPSLTRATRSATDAVTLVVEGVIRPFDQGKMREMHIHLLPWPTNVLAGLGEIEVSLRVTLSYFIEPNPGSRGWKRRYAYPSHGLRFALKRATETVHQFRQRVNVRAREEDENWVPGQGVAETGRWMFGSDLRTVGSLHTDIWTGQAADLAARGAIAVYPISGWWKERPELDHSNLGARYALVVSIITPEDAADVWTPIAQEVAVPIEILAE
jgi:hypothetical protein